MLFGNLIYLALVYFLWKAIYESSGADVVNGMTFYDTMIYLILATAIFNLLEMFIVWDMSRAIQSGEIIMHLLKPMPFRLYTFWSYSGAHVNNFFLAFLPTFVIVAVITNGAIPLGWNLLWFMVSLILALVVMRKIFRVDPVKENARLEAEHVIETHDPDRVTVVITNPQLDGKKVYDIARLLNRHFVISRTLRPGSDPVLADAQTEIRVGDKVFFVSDPRDTEAVTTFLGERIEMDQEVWDRISGATELVSRRILVTRSNVNGKPLGSLQLRNHFKVNVTRVNRAGVDLIASPSLSLQVGDRLTVVGTEASINAVAGLLGNSSKRLREPNLIPMFIGILLGVALGMIPFHISGIPLPVKLGLAGGPLIVAILLSRFGARFHLVTYTTMSASLMLREIGISLFLAAVGLSAGPEFVQTLQGGGLVWVGYGFLITVIPILIVGLLGRWVFKYNYFELMGTLSGSMTDPIALSFVSSNSPNDIPAVSYSTVYPLTMFLRVISAQILILAAL